MPPVTETPPAETPEGAVAIVDEDPEKALADMESESGATPSGGSDPLAPDPPPPPPAKPETPPAETPPVTPPAAEAPPVPEEKPSEETPPAAPAPETLIAGKFKTVEDQTAAYEAAQKKLTEMGQQVSELQRRAKPGEGSIDALLASGQFEKAEEKMAILRNERETRNTAVLAEHAIDPQGSFDRMYTERQEREASEVKAETEYDSSLRTLYPEGQFDGFADARAGLLSKYKAGEVGSTQLLHMAAVGQAFMNGGLTETKAAPGEIVSAETLAGGPPVVSPEPEKGKPRESEEDASLREMDEMGDPSGGPMM